MIKTTNFEDLERKKRKNATLTLTEKAKIAAAAGRN
jgi:hypothetical protein